MTNRCRANPNNSPDSPSNGESGEVFGFALHLFVTKLQASVVIDYPRCNVASYAFRRYVHLASYASSRWASYGVKCSKGLTAWPKLGLRPDINWEWQMFFSLLNVRLSRLEQSAWPVSGKELLVTEFNLGMTRKSQQAVFNMELRDLRKPLLS